MKITDKRGREKQPEPTVIDPEPIPPPPVQRAKQGTSLYTVEALEGVKGDAELWAVVAFCPSRRNAKQAMGQLRMQHLGKKFRISEWRKVDEPRPPRGEHGNPKHAND